jgi:hypothetical protein
MNKLILLSTIAVVLSAVSPLSASAGVLESCGTTAAASVPTLKRKTVILTPAPNDPRPATRRFGTLLRSVQTESGNSMEMSLVSLTTVVNDDGTETTEFNAGFEFEDETMVMSKFAVTPDGNLVIDDNFEYLVSLLDARPDLLLMVKNEPVGVDNPSFGADETADGFWKCFKALVTVAFGSIMRDNEIIDIGIKRINEKCRPEQPA